MEVDGENTSVVRNVKELKRNIEAKSRVHSPLLRSCCIFKVPEVIRRHNEHAYEPNIVSIGPFHHGKEKFQLLEYVKHWYFTCLINSSSENVSLDSLIEGIMDLAKSAQDCYVAYPLDGDLDQKYFVEMMIFDGCFLLELFRKEFSRELRNENDPVFNVSCMLGHLYHDLLLLENQLPWSVLEYLYNHTPNRPGLRNVSLSSLVVNFFRQSKADDQMFPSFEDPSNILHILDLLRFVILSRFKETSSGQKKEGSNLSHRMPNATTLSEAGIRFEKSQNIEFKNGVFTIPPLEIDERTGPLFRNLIAFEQCYHGRPHMITSYAVLMDNLIDSREDIDFLCEKGILANWLHPDDAAQFFNRLYDDTTIMEYYYSDLSDNVNNYYKTKWHRFMEILRHDYFSTPWRIISFIAAFILLVLTLVQTLYAIRWP